MRPYRIRYDLWKIQANSPAEAKKAVCEILRKNPEKWISVEPLTNNRPIWLRILTGK